MKMWSASLEFQMENDLLTDFFLPQIADSLFGLLIYIRHNDSDDKTSDMYWNTD